MSTEEYLKDITEIKDMMNKSSRFFSLSGLSGIMAGIYALIGAAVAYYLVSISGRNYLILDGKIFNYILLDLVLVAFLSIITAIILSITKAKKNNETLWNSASKRLLTAFLIPLVTGGIYIIIKISSDHYGLTGSLMLIFYGLALVNASKYTIGNVKYLGYIEIVLGLICAIYPGYGFWFWVLGFGVMHIIYGSLIYFNETSNSKSKP
ncbi:hypothetical protein IWQ47_000698 [Aquimarina sp. EL_43]|uniref:Membrane protein n=1 Tax=Aquimarina atlantica TaxID=1317122 RepID=A0A023BSR2_9FLAO|nr:MULTISPECIES: hypothetical protein [Aquimarina]EZH72999.1 membrane protein [Aquimarina atlantica]MBG6128612.1 hypothetical protein [Aquimarina sp. EL_35]MBG6149675.1 hypothetical protein [Aquimarina sp. EL_32]MBG6167640.1 hypothetical protein [Aquimarina sp. EL_43]